MLDDIHPSETLLYTIRFDRDTVKSGLYYLFYIWENYLYYTGLKWLIQNTFSSDWCKNLVLLFLFVSFTRHFPLFKILNCYFKECFILCLYFLVQLSRVVIKICHCFLPFLLCVITIYFKTFVSTYTYLYVHSCVNICSLLSF